MLPLSPSRMVPRPKPGTPPTVVLVIDEDAAARKGLQRLLVKHGFRAVEAENGRTGLRAARTVKPSLIFLGALTSPIDEWEILRALKADPPLKPCPVIMLGEAEDRATARARGAADLLVKPIDADALTRMLERLGPLPAPAGLPDRQQAGGSPPGELRIADRAGKGGAIFHA
jgi:PleD family two-component response regulator